MIAIYGTIINEADIIGVGPLMVKQPADPTIRQLYQERAYYFTVYTQKYHFTISTDWLSYADENQVQASKMQHDVIVQAYKDLKQCLISGSFTVLSISEND